MDYAAESKSEQRDAQIPEGAQLRELRRRLSLAPHNNDLRMHLAHWLADHGKRKEALDELRTLVRLDPNHLVARKFREELARDPESPGSSSSRQTSEALH